MKLIGGLEILTTDEWGARTRRGYPEIRKYAYKGVVNHHTSGPNRALIPNRLKAKQAAVNLAGTTQSWHMDHNGWADSGHHFLISRDGIICEGRHGSIASVASGKNCIVGAHAADSDKGVNFNDWVGIEHEGNYIEEFMPRAQLEASIMLQAWICMCCGIDTSTIIGHVETGCATACPGACFLNHMGDMRKEVHNKKLYLMELKGGK